MNLTHKLPYTSLYESLYESCRFQYLFVPTKYFLFSEQEVGGYESGEDYGDYSVHGEEGGV